MQRGDRSPYVGDAMASALRAGVDVRPFGDHGAIGGVYEPRVFMQGITRSPQLIIVPIG